MFFGFGVSGCFLAAASRIPDAGAWYNIPMKKTLLALAHFLLTILTWTAWFWLDWGIIAALSLAHIVMLESLDGCPLSHAQFGDKKGTNMTFYEWWLGRFGVKNYNRKQLKVFMRYWVPLIIVVLGVITQEMLGFRVLSF